MKRGIAVGLCWWFWVGTSYAGKLSDVREETGSSSSSSSNSSYEDGDDCSFLAALFSDCDEAAAPSSRFSPGPGYGSEATPPGAPLVPPWYFPLYPYRARAPGNLVRRRYPIDLEASGCTALDEGCLSRTQSVTCVDEVCYSPPYRLESPEPDESAAHAAWPPVDRLQSARLQLQFDGGADSDGLYRGTLGGSLDTNRDWGLESRFTYWLEPLPEGETDGTWIGDVNLRYAILALPALQVRLGLGPRILVDGETKAAGVNATVGLELYPVNPLVLRLDADAGTLGEAVVLESQASAGVLLWRAELLAGVSVLRVGSVTFDSVFAGVRFHL